MQSKREEYLAKLAKKRLSPYIKVITGIRRCGKSYLLKTLYRDYLRSAGVDNRQIVSVELDDDRFEELRDKNALRSYIENKCSDDGLQYYVFIDEVQMAAGFEGAILLIGDFLIAWCFRREVVRSLFQGLKMAMDVDKLPHLLSTIAR